MEKKEYKQPEVKVVEVEETILQDTSNDNYLDTGENGDAVAKRGSFDFDTED